MRSRQKHMQAIAYNKEGRPIVRIGNERLDSVTSPLSGDGFVVCRDHGTLPVVFVRTTHPHLAIYRCCSACITAHCRVTSTFLHLGSHERLADGSIIVNKIGHEDLSE